MKHKVSELSGELLDAAVAKAEGDKWEWPSPYSSLWERGGPIIERERITVSSPREFSPRWSAVCFLRPSEVMVRGEGRTPLIAAMRAYVSSKFGDEVELP
jgi:hypothetical protein